jgi:hypothetical protein
MVCTGINAVPQGKGPTPWRIYGYPRHDGKEKDDQLSPAAPLTYVGRGRATCDSLGGVSAEWPWFTGDGGLRRWCVGVCEVFVGVAGVSRIKSG